MGQSLRSEGGPPEVITVQEGRAAGVSAQDDRAFMRQLAELRHSLPILPDSVTDPSSSTWSKALAATSLTGSSSSSSASVLGTHLDPEPLAKLVEDYQRYSRWHCRRIVERQEQLNAAVPQAEERAARLQQRLAGVCRDAVAAQANMAAVQDIRQELAELTARLQRLQRSIAELNELRAEQGRQQARQEGLQAAPRQDGGERVTPSPPEVQVEQQGPALPPST